MVLYKERLCIMERLSWEREMTNRHHIWAVMVVKPKSGDPVGHYRVLYMRREHASWSLLLCHGSQTKEW